MQFSLGCPTGGFTPASLAQAVLLFKNDGVTDVTGSGANSAAAEFSTEAATQNYKPIYVLNTDELGIGTQAGIAAGTPANLNGAVNIETNAYGEQTTPGYKPSGGTKKCDAIFVPIRDRLRPIGWFRRYCLRLLVVYSGLSQGCYLAAAGEACRSNAHDRDCRPLVSDCTDKLCCRTRKFNLWNCRLAC